MILLKFWKTAESEAEKARQMSDEFFEAYEVLGQVHLIRVRQLMQKARSPLKEFERCTKNVREID